MDVSHTGRPAERSGRRRARLHRRVSVGWGVATVIALVLAIPCDRPSAASPARMIGVVDFYALSPAPAVDGLIPEEFVADEIARMLPQATHGQVTVIPREAIRRAESALEWRTWDVLRFARLGELAQRVGADQLIVGWIPRLQLDRGGPGGGIPRIGGDRALTGSATVLVQVFDAPHGRIVAEASGDGFELGQTRLFVVGRVLHEAAARALPHVLAVLTPPP